MNDINNNLLPVMLEIWQQTLNWQPNNEQISLFQQLYEKILIGNQQFNLTRITSGKEFWEKHLWDSLRGIQFILNSQESKLDPIPTQAKIIDIGTGAGFPGIPTAIVLPQATATLMDSTQKKITFIKAIANELNLPNIHAIASRAETLGQDPHHRHSYDLALIRAVSSASVCAEYCLPLLKQGGLACIYRGHWTQAEANSLTTACQELGAEIALIEEFTTPLNHHQRTCVYLRKAAPTPTKYPRGVGIPHQHPL